MKNPKKLGRVLIGVDPGKYTGVATYDRVARQFIKVTTLSFWDAIETFKHYKEATERDGVGLTVFIEDPQPNAPTFNKGGLKGLTADQQIRAVNKISQDVGRNKQDARLLMEYCDREGIDYIPVIPTAAVRKGKVDAKYFEQITRYKGRTSQHARDAGLLIFGK